MSVTVKTTADRIDAYCSVCKEGCDAPNKGLGRAIIAAFKSRHQHPESTSPRDIEGRQQP